MTAYRIRDEMSLKSSHKYFINRYKSSDYYDFIF